MSVCMCVSVSVCVCVCVLEWNVVSLIMPLTGCGDVSMPTFEADEIILNTDCDMSYVTYLLFLSNTLVCKCRCVADILCFTKSFTDEFHVWWNL